MRRYHACCVYALLSIFAFVLSGCSAKWEKYSRVEFNYEVGSTHVAVISVTPWEEVVSDLQPNYVRTADSVLKESVPTTTRFEQIITDVMRANLSASSTAATKPPPAGTAAKPADTSAKPNQGASPTGNGATSPKPTASGQKPSGEDSATKPQNEGVDRDPMIKYQTATSLFQGIQLLNRYLHDAATRKDYRPYVVRIQVSLMPAARNMPYDAYLNISFLSKTYGKLLEEKNALEKEWYNPIVIPLIVTDDIEAMASSRSLDSIRQLGLGLTAIMSSSIEAKFDFQKSLDNLSKISGEGLNSLLSVARVSDNTIRVRLGAMHQANIGYVAVPRTHNICVLLLVPNGYEKIYIDSFTRFADSETGKMLINTEGNRQEKKEASDLLKDYGIPVTDENIRLIEAMRWNFLMNRPDFFFQNYNKLITQKEAGKSEGNEKPDLKSQKGTDFYMSVGDQAVGSVTTYASFLLPPRSHCMPKQTAPLIDDGEKTTAYLSGNCSNYTKSIKKAFLRVTDENKQAHIFPLDNFSFSNKWCEKVILEFPSLAAMNFKNLGSNAENNIELYFELNKGNEECEEDTPKTFKARYILKTKDASKPPDQTATAETQKQADKEAATPLKNAAAKQKKENSGMTR